MGGDTTREFVERLAQFDSVVEIGVGHRPEVATGLAARGVRVTATDIRERPVPTGVRFVRDDITDPDRAVYADADALFARNLPPELHRPAWDLAREVGAQFLFTTLGTEGPAVPADPEILSGTTLFTAKPQRP